MHRSIETFELQSGYYIDSFINGNKTHVVKEFKELFELDSILATKLLIDITLTDNYIGKYISDKL